MSDVTEDYNNELKGHIYLRWHPSYKQLIKMGKAQCPVERESGYITGEVNRGKYIKILRILNRDYSECECLLKHHFIKANYKEGTGGTEFFNKTIYFEIEAALDILNIQYELVNIEDINRKIRINETVKKCYQTITDKLYQKRYEMMMIEDTRVSIYLKYDYQVETHNKIMNYPKCIINWACGGGKTYISLYQLQEYKYETALIAVPSNLLLDQWLDKIKEFLPYYSILIVNSSENGTTNAREIESFMNSDDECKCVITTYHSAYRLVNHHFKIKILDEIHHLCFKTETEQNKGFKRIFDVQSDKQIGLTATCKITEDIEKIVGNNNEHYFGPIIDERNINFMIDNKAICNYNIPIIGISRNELRELMRGTVYNSNKTNEEIEPLIVASYTILKAIMMGMTHHTLIYCNTCDNAQIVKQIIDTLIEKLYSNVDLFKNGFFNNNIDSSRTYDERTELENEFNNSQIGIIPCVLIFGEGYDNSIIDSVVFAENMSSTIRIVQSGLRPTRKDENNLEKLAKLIIPVILDEHFINNESDSYCFKKLRQIIAEMSTSDNNILDRIKYFETNKDEGTSSTNMRSRFELIEVSNTEMKLRILRRNCIGKNLYKVEYYELKKLIKEFNIQTDIEYEQLLKDKDYYIKEPDIHFFETNLWKGWYDFLDIDTSKYPSDIRKFKEKCDNTGITEYAMKTKLPNDEFIRLCKINHLPYFRITDIYKDYEFSNLFIIRQDKGRRKDY